MLDFLNDLFSCKCLKLDEAENKEIIAVKSNNSKLLVNTTSSSFNPEFDSHNNNIKIKNNSINNIIQDNQSKIQSEQMQKKINELNQIISLKDSEIKNLRKKIEEISIPKNDKELILVGLNNIGATCYMNATLQCLSNTKKLRDYFLNKFNDYPNKIMSREFRTVIQNLWDKKNNKKSYSPNSFKEVLSKENPLFAGIQANDSKDLINFLIERFHQELNVINGSINNNNQNNQPDQTNENLMLAEFLKEFRQNFNSPISHLFYGLLETKSQCKGCSVIKYNFQVYSFLEFPLQQVNTFYYNMGKRPLILPNNKNPDVDLYECFEYNRKVDTMGGENQMWCNICNKLCDAFYTSLIYSAPNYLIINLNRGKGAVYECNVNFPEQLNIVNYLTYKDDNTVFDLYAVISHLGPSSMSGHFVAYCRSDKDYKWYLYNDAIVTQCTRDKQYREGMPYILFYKVIKGGPNSAY